MSSPRLDIPSWALFRIGEKDSWRCHVCEGSYRPDDPWEVDHDIPISKGGTNLIKNLRLAHRSCNRGKGAA